MSVTDSRNNIWFFGLTVSVKLNSGSFCYGSIDHYDIYKIEDY